MMESVITSSLDEESTRQGAQQTLGRVDSNLLYFFLIDPAGLEMNRNKKFPTPEKMLIFHHIGDCSPGQDIIVNIYLNRPPSLYVHLRHCPELSGESPTVGEQSHSLINMLECNKKSLPL